MNESPQGDLRDSSTKNENPFATPESVLTPHEVEKQWWVPDRPLPRPYPPPLCQAAFAVDLALSIGLGALTAYEVFDRLVLGPRYAASGLAVPPVVPGMIVGLVMWSLAIVTDSLGLLIRRGVWPWGTATFLVFWVWLGFTLIQWNNSPLALWEGPAAATAWIAARVLGNLVWFAAVVRYRLWFAERQLSQQETPSA